MADGPDPTLRPARQSRQFRFLALLGQGGFGEVYLTEVIAGSGFRKQVAVKVLKAQWTNDPEVRGRLQDEAAVLGLLRHPNIVSAEDLVELRGQPALVMEYVAGCNLTDVLKAAAASDPLPVRVVAEIGAAVASALEAAYWRPVTGTNRPIAVLHRDIKPGNIRLTPHGEVKLLDFGIARSEVLDRSVQTVDQQPGSLSYMAPELLRGEQASPESDIYSLGVVIIECLLRSRFGWAGATAEEHADKVARAIGRTSDLPHAFAATLLAALDFDPMIRPHAATLRQACRDLATSANGPGLVEWADSAVVPTGGPTGEAAPGGLVGCVFDEDRTGAVSTLVPISADQTRPLQLGAAPTQRLPAPASSRDAASSTDSGSWKNAGAESPPPRRAPVPIRQRPRVGPSPWSLIALGALGVVAITAAATLTRPGEQAGTVPANEPLPVAPAATDARPTPEADGPTIRADTEADGLRAPTSLGATPGATHRDLEADLSPSLDVDPPPVLIPIPPSQRDSPSPAASAPPQTASAPPPQPGGPLLVGLASRPAGLPVQVDGKAVSLPTPVGVPLEPGPHDIQFGDGPTVRIEVGPGQPSTWVWDLAAGRLVRQ
jgi:serine/threonine-protein kinase